MDKQTHKLLTKDIESQSGVCAVCGPVDLHKRMVNGKPVYRCLKKFKEQKAVEKARYRAKHKDKIREYNTEWSAKRRGLITESYHDIVQALFDQQNGLCVVCQREITIGKHALDHCHKTGLPRALLCQPCNRGIGLLGDNPDWLRRAAEYISQFETGLTA